MSDTPSSLTPEAAPESASAPQPEAGAPVAPATRGDRPAAPAASGDRSRRRGRRGRGGAGAGAKASPADGADASTPSPGQKAVKPANGPKGARPVHPLLQRLWALHPRLFGARFRPLKLGVFEDLMARHPGAFAKDDLKQALGQHVRSTRYLEAVAEGDARHDLDGNPVEPVAPEHVQHAILEVFRRRQGKDAAKARAWARARMVSAVAAAGVDRDAWLERARTQDPLALELLDEAFAELAAQAARREALVRTFRASGQTVEAFAEMYGLDLALVRDALAREATA